MPSVDTKRLYAWLRGMALADGYLDEREAAVLAKFGRVSGLSEDDLATIESAEDDPISLATASRYLPDAEKREAVRLLAYMMVIDGHIDPREQAYLREVTQALEVDDQTLEDIVIEEMGHAGVMLPTQRERPSVKSSLLGALGCAVAAVAGSIGAGILLWIF